MSFAGGIGSTMKLAKRKINNLGYIKSLLGVQKDPNCLRCITNKLGLAQSLPSIYNAKVKEPPVHKSAHESWYIDGGVTTTRNFMLIW